MMIVFLCTLMLSQAFSAVDIIFDKTRGAVIKNDNCFTLTVSVNSADFEVGPQSEKELGSPKWSEWKWFPGTKGSVLLKEVRSPLKHKTKVDHGPGTGIHSGNQINAYDFEAPVGTPVHAVADGIVVKVVEKYSQNHRDFGRRNEVNEVEVLHADGTSARYVHLEHKGAQVKVCEKVLAGQLLARSGNTGYSDGPHLHLEVYRPTGSSQFTTLPLIFRDYIPSK